MDLQDDKCISELKREKAKPPACLQVGGTDLNRDTGGSPQQPYGDSVPHLVDAMRGRPVSRAPEDLHVHPALAGLDGMDVADQLNEAEGVRHHATTPILVTSERTVLSGFGRWRSALLHEECEIPCIEYVLGQEDSLQFILAHHKPQRGWNAFIRTRLALTLEPYFQRGALDNMREGGRYKGSAKLPNAQHVDVRRRIAEIAGVGARNVSNVKMILSAAHPRLLTALGNGTLTINKALRLCKLPRADQLEAFSQSLEQRAIDKIIRATLRSSNKTWEPTVLFPPCSGTPRMFVPGTSEGSASRNNLQQEIKMRA